MIQDLTTVTLESFTKLRRDKIFLPALIGGGGLLFLATLIGFWGIEEFYKIIYDIGTAGLAFISATVAIFWGTKSVADSKTEGSIEVQLASPIDRSVWLCGKFLGLAIGLLVLGICFLAFWQGLCFYYGMGVIPSKVVVIFFLITLGSMVLGALATFLSTVCTQATALFSAFVLWILGLLSEPISLALSPNTDEASKFLVSLIARFWNFQVFNLSEYAYTSSWPSSSEILFRYGYGFLCIIFLLSLSCFIFKHKDVT